MSDWKPTHEQCYAIIRYTNEHYHECPEGTFNNERVLVAAVKLGYLVPAAAPALNDEMIESAAFDRYDTQGMHSAATFFIEGAKWVRDFRAPMLSREQVEAAYARPKCMHTDLREVIYCGKCEHEREARITSLFASGEERESERRQPMSDAERIFAGTALTDEQRAGGDRREDLR